MPPTSVSFIGRVLLFAVVACGSVGCRQNSKTSRDAGAPDGGASMPNPDAFVAGIRGRLRDAELRRDSKSVQPDDLSHRDPRVRIQAAQALARIGQPSSLPLLRRALHDEHPTVVAWAAYGLGYQCGGHADTVRMLVARAVTLATKRQGGALNHRAEGSTPLDPWFAITDALARCGSSAAERVLRSWILPESPAPRHAALAIGRLATRARRLEDATLVALVDAASRTERPLVDALYPFGRLPTLEESLAERVFAVASSVLSSKQDGASHAIAALARTGERGIPKLKAAAENPDHTSGLRAAAIVSLASLGAKGQAALRQLLLRTDLAAPSNAWTTADWAVFESVLDGLEPPALEAAPILVKLSSADVPEEDGVLRRRVIHARCQAASILAGRTTFSKQLLSCDPSEKGREGKLALLRVLDRAKLGPRRIKQWRSLVRSDDPWVQQGALRLLISHGEVRGAPEFLARALLSKRPGVVATAAEVLTASPDRAGTDGQPGRGLRPEPKVVKSLDRALAAEWAPDATETLGALAQAAGSMQLLGSKPQLEKLCAGAVAGLRQRVRKALMLLGERNPACGNETLSRPVATPVWVREKRVRIRFDTSVGPLDLELDASLAPAAVRRVAELVESGFYSNVLIHRVVPGFVVQFGDPGGDGYGGAGLPPIPCETTPRPFVAGSVGMALSGRDTGSSQMFITLGAFPHLDGDYPLIGQAGAGWDRLAVGDIILSASVLK